MSTEMFCVRPMIYMSKKGLDEILSGVESACIVTDRFMCESGAVDYLTVPLEHRGIRYHIFDGVKPDPDLGTVAQIVNIYVDQKPDVLFAFGGGSPIDAAKAAVYMAGKLGAAKRCTFVAVPTTSGTGTEVTRFSVVTDPATQTKYPMADPEMVPDAAILDCYLTCTVPPGVTADTGIDVFTHAVESFVSTAANDFSDACAEKAIKLCRSNLYKAYSQPDDPRARQAMHNASCLAGIAFNNSGLGLNHGMAHTLGAHFHLPHGRCCGILLPYVMSYNAGCRTTLTPAAKKYARIARLLNIDGATFRQSTFSAVRSTKAFLQKLDMPDCIKDAGVGRAEFLSQLDEMTEDALNDATTATNPIVPDRDGVRDLFLRAYDGRL
ncbi:MAG: iron-containing alcohol dehydrogenase [Lachnospiraceae bacterium]|nr:iron-containing alcohol dehydrogenase [Lachnospiraceae bacterium]